MIWAPMATTDYAERNHVFHYTETPLKPKVFLWGFINCQLSYLCIRITAMTILKNIFLAFSILLASYDLVTTYAQAIVQLQDRNSNPLHSLGYQFKGLETIFKNVRTIGYYTDKDLNNSLAIAQFEQAQYMLAPTVLDLNQTKYRWVIFDCTSPHVALEAIKKSGLTPLKENHGIILALNQNGI